jgi:hypothetical protein
MNKTTRVFVLLFSLFALTSSPVAHSQEAQLLRSIFRAFNFGESRIIEDALTGYCKDSGMVIRAYRNPSFKGAYEDAIKRCKDGNRDTVKKAYAEYNDQELQNRVAKAEQKCNRESQRRQDELDGLPDPNRIYNDYPTRERLREQKLHLEVMLNAHEMQCYRLINDMTYHEGYYRYIKWATK